MQLLYIYKLYDKIVIHILYYLKSIVRGLVLNIFKKYTYFYICFFFSHICNAFYLQHHEISFCIHINSKLFVQKPQIDLYSILFYTDFQRAMLFYIK